MFLEHPSLRSTIEAFMSKKGRTYQDFSVMFNFNRVIFGVSYITIQACTVILADAINKFPIYMGSIEDKISTQILDNGNAIMYINLNNYSVEIKYQYRVDNFPSLRIAVITEDSKRSLYNTNKISMDTDIPGEIVLDTVDTIYNHLIEMLYLAYEVQNEND